MRLSAKAFAVLFAMGLVACATLPEEAQPPKPPGLAIACTNNSNEDLSLLNWELQVSAGPIVSGEPFRATLDGVAVFDEAFWDQASGVLRVEAVNVVDLRATVHVRSGTTGDDDVTLEPDPSRHEYKCRFDGSVCNPANDIDDPDDPRDVAGLQANSDCQPPAKFTNPCGRFVKVPTDDDCDPGGLCRSRGKGEQCDRHGFCITGGVEIELKEVTADYIAAAGETEVLFGWDDKSTGAILEEEGPNAGTWSLRSIYHEDDFIAGYEEEQGPIGVRATLSGIPGALECTMAVSCADPDFALTCPPGLTTLTPDEALISFPIQPEAP